jgi:hypothetical protein
MHWIIVAGEGARIARERATLGVRLKNGYVARPVVKERINRRSPTRFRCLFMNVKMAKIRDGPAGPKHL